MALPPHALGTRARTVRLERVDARGWRVSVDARPLSPTFASEGDARDAGGAEVVRLVALALALLRRVRARSSRSGASAYSRSAADPSAGRCAVGVRTSSARQSMHVTPAACFVELD